MTCQLLAENGFRAEYCHSGLAPQRKRSGKIPWPRCALNWQITLAPGVANNFGPTPAKVENYHGPRHAYAAKVNNVLDDADWVTWCGYFYDIGVHPIFLSAIYFGHKYGYFDGEFAKEIQKRLCENDKNADLLQKIYPELLEQDWPEKVGKNRAE